MTPTTPASGCKAPAPTLAQGDGILIVDADEKIVQINTILQNLLGVTQEELAGADALQTIRRHLAPMLRDEGACGQVIALLQGGPDSQSLTVDVRIPEIGIRRLSVTTSAVDTAGPEIQLLIFHDTGEGDAEFFRDAIEASPITVFAQDHGLRYIWVCGPQQSGFLPAGIVGSTDADLFGPEDAARLTELKRRIMETGEVVRGELPLTIDGAVRTFDQTLKPMRDSDGRVKGVLGTLFDITGRQQAVEALARSERQLATLMSNLRGMAYRCKFDREWTMEFVSEGALRVTGYAPEDLIGNRRVAYGDLIHPDDRERVWEEVSSGFSRQMPFQTTYRLIGATGEEKWVWEQGRGVPEPGGGVVALEGYITDITDRVRAEAALAESEERLRSIFSTSHAVMLIIDAETGAIVDANPAASAYYGYPHDILTAMRITDINVLGERETFRAMQKAEAGEEQHFIVRHRLADGRVRDVDVFSGRVVVHGRAFLHSIIHDVTERRQAEEQFRALLDAIPDAAMLIDRDGTLLALNEVMAARFGKSVGEILGTCAYDLLTPELAATRRELTDRAVALGKPLRHIDERGGLVLENVLFPVPGARAGAEWVAVISRDITRQSELERVRKEAFDRIEENIEQFATLGDHVRQPLQVILGMACLLEDERATKAIQQEVGRINGYITQLDQGWIESRKIREFLRRHELV